eukprot:7556103-Pyramimonas_sp.AAC.1
MSGVASPRRMRVAASLASRGVAQRLVLALACDCLGEGGRVVGPADGVPDESSSRAPVPDVL